MRTRYQDQAEGSHWFGPTDSTCLQGIRSGLQNRMGKAHEIEHADTVSGWGCRISRVGNTRSNMPTGYQDGAAGSHGFGTPYCTCLEGKRKGLQDLMGK